MINRSRGHRTPVALATLGVLAALMVAVPILDLGHAPGPVGIAEEASGGWFDHDHRICLQHGTTTWSPAGAISIPADLAVRDDRLPSLTAAVSELEHRSAHRPRAPPHV